MSEWEDIFLKEVSRIIFRFADPHKLTKYLIMSLGVPSRTLESKLKNKRKLGPVIIGDFDGISVAIAPRQSGTIQLEEFLRLIPPDTVQYIIGLGAVGALQSDIQIGDLIVPTQAIRGEGLTGYYYPPEEPALPDPMLVEILSQCAENTKARIHKGTIFTTGSLLHETDELIGEWHDNGYIGVDCEASAFFLLCKYCGFMGAMILYVSDNPFTKQVFTKNFGSILRVFRAERKAARSIYQTISMIEGEKNGEDKG